MARGDGDGLKLLLLVVAAYVVYQAMKVNFKPGVNASGVQPQTWFALAVAEATRIAQGLPDLTVTSLLDGIHPAGAQHGRVDLHYTGNAADLRTSDIPPDLIAQWYADLKNKLYPLGYDVVQESDHIHVEYDPKAGRSLGSGVGDFLTQLFGDVEQTLTDLLSKAGGNA